MPDIRDSNLIQGVRVAHLQAFADERGRFLESFRRSWFPERSWEHMQTNRSNSRQGVLRGLHFHHRQVDYWYLVEGSIRVGLYDLRRSSPTRGRGEMFDITAEEPRGLFVPVGVAHGFLALTDAVLTYIVDQYYDDSDEFGVAWNDPQLALPWGTETPTLSPRDLANPLLRDIPEDQLPG
jgi:dTDP-4-dehydrorhamnose 3,5-epimerase